MAGKVVVEVTLVRDVKTGDRIPILINAQELILSHETRHLRQHLRCLRQQVKEAEEELWRERESLAKKVEKRVRNELMRRERKEKEHELELRKRREREVRKLRKQREKLEGEWEDLRLRCRLMKNVPACTEASESKERETLMELESNASQIPPSLPSPSQVSVPYNAPPSPPSPLSSLSRITTTE